MVDRGPDGGARVGLRVPEPEPAGHTWPEPMPAEPIGPIPLASG
ncbi:hypothetical protein [Micromonospora sp. NPDC005305]